MANLQKLSSTASAWARIALLRQSGTACLAPQFRAAVERAIGVSNALGADAMIFETCRCNELQQIYFQQGTTHAKTAWYSWHLYGLAVDVISASRHWDAWRDRTWRDTVVSAFKEETYSDDDDEHTLLDWGGDWAHGVSEDGRPFDRRDLPHFQWGRCRPTPTILSIEAYKRGGKEAVWPLVHAA